jgi:hypothetical protein
LKCFDTIEGLAGSINILTLVKINQKTMRQVKQALGIKMVETTGNGKKQ